ncbi:MAG TPA: hypothetical protein VHH36_00485, partial [Candidatus Thermoplasmatota archaeon]|nr:hypothetical protein [Candidatus Thermoplasmatota archaeon]
MSTKINPGRGAKATFFALLMLAQIVPAADAQIEGDAPRDAQDARDGAVDDGRGTADGVAGQDVHPTIDYLRDDVLAAFDRAVRDLNARLGDNASAGSIVEPRVAAHAFDDRADPGARVGGIGSWQVLGEGWRVSPGAGPDGSAAWTTTDDAGRYRTMDSILVSPAIDLSAYPIPATEPAGMRAYQAARSANAVTGRADVDITTSNDDPIVLVLTHRFNFPERMDGGQVLVFLSPPKSVEGGSIAFPETPDVYRARVLALNQTPGLTGYRPWNVTAFDLTPYAGHTIWLGLRVAATPAAEDPAYFPRAFPVKQAPFGWIVDRVEVLTPALAANAKAYAIVGPSYRADPTDPYPLVPPGENVTVGVVALNAGSVGRNTTAEVSVEGIGSWTFTRFLRASEAALFNVTFVAPNETNATFAVSANVRHRSSLGESDVPEPMATDNRPTPRTYQVRAVPRATAILETTPSIAQIGDSVRARLTIQNTGNVPLRAVAALDDAWNDSESGPSRVGRGTRSASIAPGSTGVLEWPLLADERGAHNLTVDLDLGPAGKRVVPGAYYVEISPPPLFRDVD